MNIKNLIKNINGIGFPDDVRLMLLNTIISSISENSWNLIDNNYNLGINKYRIVDIPKPKYDKPEKIYNDIMTKKPQEWNEEFADIVYDDVDTEGIIVDEIEGKKSIIFKGE